MTPDESLEITWYGQSMFAISGGGMTIVLDPMPPEVGYRYEPIAADAVLVSHGHFDHSFLAGVTGDPRVFDTSGPLDLDGLVITGIDSFHDGSRGKERGSNVVFTWEQAGFHLAYLGDLGDPSDIAALDILRCLDVAMMPVGGIYTIDGEQAARLAAVLSPAVVIPMHYGTPDCVIPLDPIDGFESAFSGPVRAVAERPLVITRDSMPMATEAWIVPYR